MTQLEDLPTTDSGHIKKQNAMDWLRDLDKASLEELKKSVFPKPSDFSGSKYSTKISNIRLTGGPEFIEAAGSLLKPLLDFEDEDTRVEINLQQSEDRDTGELTENFALYLSIAERG